MGGVSDLDSPDVELEDEGAAPIPPIEGRPADYRGDPVRSDTGGRLGGRGQGDGEVLGTQPGGGVLNTDQPGHHRT